ncbi:MAG: hypothetical protein EOP54_22935 [Sphingobacteriales bacterium]|nr:MAG: hypothetical protein EOP54_22935 [Sphingobacteriales bacterium]
MATDTNYGQDQDGQDVTMNGGFYSGIPYGDPADINPEELATFPKQVNSTGLHHHESHLVSHRTPVRDGRNITRTDNHPSRGGYM